MRTVHWLFVVSAALFVSGVGFVIAGAKAMQATPVQAAAPTVVPVATVKQIMDGIVMPGANAIWESVSTIVDAKGIQEHRPETDAEWQAVGDSAAALIESANLLMLGSRVVDHGDWVKMATAMADAAKRALAAAEAKDTDGILAAGEVINETCDACHARYLRN